MFPGTEGGCPVAANPVDQGFRFLTSLCYVRNDREWDASFGMTELAHFQD